MNGSDTRSPRVAIVLATRNGARYLSAQLDSIEAQSHPDWVLWASDDGSADETLDILADYQQRWGGDKLKIVDGPRRGVAKNFIATACRPDLRADYVAFSDQDDVWEPDKLAQAIAHLARLPPSSPSLYCGRTRLVDTNDRELGLSWLFSDRPSFQNALAQNIGGGNTMLFNAKTLALLRRTGADLPILLHDWWLYLLVTGVGGHVVYDPRPFVRYRQHDGNVVGSNLGLSARMARAFGIAQGRLKQWNDQNLDCLDGIDEWLTPRNRLIVKHFREARQGPLWRRMAALRRSGVYRQQLSGNVGLILAVCLARL